jgi:2'-5' RNA ligase
VKSGIIIISELRGPLRDQILDLQRQFDPKLAESLPPHVTITGSSGIGPISSKTTVDELRRALEPITSTTPAMDLAFQAPTRFMQTNVVVLPLDPHGPLRGLHDRIRASGLTYERPRFTFTPHVTLSFFPQLTSDNLRELLAVHIAAPVRVDRIQFYETRAITETKRVLELTLGGA